MRGCINDTEACSRGGRISSGKRKRLLAIRRCGVAAMRPGCIPAWWYNLAVKPDPRVMFEADAWPDTDRRGCPIAIAWHIANQSRIHGLYKWRPWYPAFAREISWYQLCRERESMTAPDRDLKRKTFSSDDC